MIAARILLRFCNFLSDQEYRKLSTPQMIIQVLIDGKNHPRGCTCLLHLFNPQIKHALAQNQLEIRYGDQDLLSRSNLLQILLQLTVSTNGLAPRTYLLLRC